MTIRMRVGLLIVLCIAFVSAAIGLHGQAPSQLQPLNEVIISGADLGFRVEGRKGSNITGTPLRSLDNISEYRVSNGNRLDVDTAVDDSGSWAPSGSSSCHHQCTLALG